MKLINLSDEDLEKGKSIVEDLNKNGKTAVYIAIDGKLKGIIATIDSLNEDAENIIDVLKKSGKKVVILTGEHQDTAEKYGDILGIDNIISDVIPVNRARKVRSFQYDKKIVVMIGDGINDAGAIAQANAGIAIGTPENITTDAADIVLLNNNLLSILKLFALSKKTYKNMKENLFFALIYNILTIPFAAGILYALGLNYYFNPLLALVCMFLGSLSVVLNALRLNYFK